MKCKIIDIETGEKRMHPMDAAPFNWSEGNLSCDCNRVLAFSDIEDDDFECGHSRFLVVESFPVDGESEGEPYTLAELNLDYPEELLRQIGIIKS